MTHKIGLIRFSKLPITLDLDLPLKKIKMMNRLIILVIVILTSTFVQAQHYESAIDNGTAEINVLYFENSPFVYEKNGQVGGIEVDILNYFKNWLKENKEINLSFNYQKQDEFNQLIEKVSTAEDGTIAIGAISNTKERQSKVFFTAPYMKNVSVLVTSGSIETMRSDEDIKNTIPLIKPVSVQGSTHEQYIQNLYKSLEIELEKIKFVKYPSDILASIKDSPRTFGYVDVITLWSYLQKNEVYIKIHRIANISNENFAIATPINSRWQLIFNEFLESGFGFTATKDYRKILDKHLGYEVLSTVELNP